MYYVKYKGVKSGEEFKAKFITYEGFITLLDILKDWQDFFKITSIRKD